ARLSMWSQFVLVLVGVVLLPAFGIGQLLLLWAWIICRTTELAVTNKRIISKSGVIQRTTMELSLDKIESIKVDQGIMGRILNFGLITISGTGGDKTPIESIADPLQFQKHFMSAVDARRS
ncbi:MAG: PH domain-containing protein, partial [Sulfuricaulis sp.]|nr:PH domain-containing protein [Sulfuricaulis sp.]